MNTKNLVPDNCEALGGFEQGTEANLILSSMS